MMLPYPPPLIPVPPPSAQDLFWAAAARAMVEVRSWLEGSAIDRDAARGRMTNSRPEGPRPTPADVIPPNYKGDPDVRRAVLKAIRTCQCVGCSLGSGTCRTLGAAGLGLLKCQQPDWEGPS